MDMFNTKNVGNTVYQGAVITVLTVGISMASKKIIGQGIGDLTKPGLKEVGKLAGATAIAIGLKKYLEKQGLPKDPMQR